MPYPVEPAQLPAEFDLDTLVVTPPDIDYTFHELVTELNTVPAVAGSITIPVDSALRYAVGVPLYFAGHGVFRVIARNTTADTITIENVTATPAIALQIGTPFNVCALPPVEDEDAAENLIYDVVTTQFTIPAVGSAVTILVSRGGWLVVDGVIFVEDAGWFRVVTIPTTQSCTATYLYTNGGAAPGGTVSPGARVHAVSELVYSPDNVTILHSNASATPGSGQIAVGPQFPQTPSATGVVRSNVKIQYGSLAAATYATSAELAAITFPTPFSVAPVVTVSFYSPSNKVLGELFMFKFSELSATGFRIVMYCSASSGANAVLSWTAIGI